MNAVPDGLASMPPAHRLAAALSLLLAVVLPAVSLAIPAAFLPHGHPQPSAGAVFAKAFVTVGLLPLAATAALLVVGRRLAVRGNRDAGLVLLALPAAAAPILFVLSLS